MQEPRTAVRQAGDCPTTICPIPTILFRVVSKAVQEAMILFSVVRCYVVVAWASDGSCQ